MFNQTITQVNFAEEELAKEYDNCTFQNCLFIGANLSHINFVDCIFENCDFSMAIIEETVFNNIRFQYCKLLGLHFEDCNQFIVQFRFEHCNLELASFHKMKLKEQIFFSCNLSEVDFTETDLEKAVFTASNLEKAMFDFTNLEEADFRTAIDFEIDPEKNKIGGAKFSKQALGGLLGKYRILID